MEKKEQNKITEIDDLKAIKKLYGEEFMKLCKKLFPTILEQKGKLIKIFLVFALQYPLLASCLVQNTQLKSL